MNPNAKEFVPAHLLKKRQDEASVGELTSQVASVDLDENKRDASKPQENGERVENLPESEAQAAAAAAAATTCSKGNAQDQAQAQENQNNSSPKKQLDGSAEAQQQQHNSSTSNHHNQCSASTNNNVHLKTNGDCNQDPNENDRHLLRAGENYCEFNGEQFIIPGEDDEYTSSGQDYQPPGYDFGNPEDNEDEDVCNEYEKFCNELPQ